MVSSEITARMNNSLTLEENGEKDGIRESED
jgi:hypothetical protein